MSELSYCACPPGSCADESDPSCTRKMELLEWRSVCTRDGDFLHAPLDGICWSCSANLVEHYIKTGKASATGCPKCHRSFVE